MKKKLITRTIFFTKADVKVLNQATGEISVRTVTMPGDFNNSKSVLSTFNRKFKEHNEQGVFVEHYEPANILMGLSVEDFQKYGVQLDPVTRKPIDGSELPADVELEEAEDEQEEAPAPAKTKKKK